MRKEVKQTYHEELAELWGQGHRGRSATPAQGRLAKGPAKAGKGMGDSQAEGREAILERGNRLCKGRGRREAGICRMRRREVTDVPYGGQVTDDLPSHSSNLKATDSTEMSKQEGPTCWEYPRAGEVI